MPLAPLSQGFVFFFNLTRSRRWNMLPWKLNFVEIVWVDLMDPGLPTNLLLAHYKQLFKYTLS